MAEPGAGHDRGMVPAAAHAVRRDARADPDGNERLTSVNATVLLALLAAEGLTIVSVRQLITPHIVIGLVLVGPVVLKCVTTMHRFWRYYTGNEAYVEKGPPHPLLRVAGPVVILSSLAVLGTGVALLAVRPGEGPLLLLHKATFVIWFLAMTVHVLGHVVQAFRSTAAEYRRLPSPVARRRRAMRSGAVVLSLLAGVGLAAALLPSASPWINRPAGVEHGLHQNAH